MSIGSLSIFSSAVKLYTDDTKLYREIGSIPDEAYVLQSDIFRPTEWCKTWHGWDGRA